jgi:hypothetical protein
MKVDMVVMRHANSSRLFLVKNVKASIINAGWCARTSNSGFAGQLFREKLGEVAGKKSS